MGIAGAVRPCQTNCRSPDSSSRRAQETNWAPTIRRCWPSTPWVTPPFIAILTSYVLPPVSPSWAGLTAIRPFCQRISGIVSPNWTMA